MDFTVRIISTEAIKKESNRKCLLFAEVLLGGAVSLLPLLVSSFLLPILSLLEDCNRHSPRFKLEFQQTLMVQIIFNPFRQKTHSEKNHRVMLNLMKIKIISLAQIFINFLFTRWSYFC